MKFLKHRPMADFGGGLAALPALSLRELRVLASRLGLGRYGALTRRSLVEAIHRSIARQPTAQPIGPLPVEITPLASSVPPIASVAAERSWVVLQPQPDQWAEVRWHLAAEDRVAALAAGGTSLVLRLSDVTGRSDGAALPHALQEVTVDTAGERWYLPIPLAGRSYRVELGYRRADRDGWIPVVGSAVVTVEHGAQPEPIAVSAAPFELTPPEPSASEPAVAMVPGLHERLYQAASASWRLQRVGSEEFQQASDLAAAAAVAGQHQSGAGFWASGRQESGAGGPAARQRSFWLVADAELIVHAATEPSALLSIGDQPQALSQEGTIRVHVPFPDGEQHYPIRALAADGEQSRHVTLSFVRSTPKAHVNTREQAVPEWF